VNEEQTALLELIERLLSCVSEDPEYRHLRTKIGEDEVFLEDTVQSVLLISKIHGTILDMERYKGGDTFMTWKASASAEITRVLNNYYILEMMAGI